MSIMAQGFSIVIRPHTIVGEAGEIMAQKGELEDQV